MWGRAQIAPQILVSVRRPQHSISPLSSNSSRHYPLWRNVSNPSMATNDAQASSQAGGDIGSTTAASNASPTNNDAPSPLPSPTPLRSYQFDGGDTVILHSLIRSTHVNGRRAVVHYPSISDFELHELPEGLGAMGIGVVNNNAGNNNANEGQG